MKNKMKFRLIYGVCILVIAVIVFIYGIISDNAFMSGFGTGFGFVGIFNIIKIIRIMNDKDKLKKLEIKENDERNKKIVNLSYALSFRIFIMLEAIACLVLTIMQYNDYVMIIAYILCCQLITYLLCTFIISRRI